VHVRQRPKFRDAHVTSLEGGMTAASDHDWHNWRERLFVSAGVQYYIAARASTLAGLMPVSGNLFHHAVEMLLKAGIIKHGAMENISFDKTDQHLRSLGHKLIKSWDQFKALHPAENLGRWDALIADLDRWEEIRYFPKRQTSMSMTVDFRKEHRAQRLAIAPQRPGKVKVTEYALPLEECDEFLKEIWRLLGFTPEYFKIASAVVMRAKARELYLEENLHRIYQD
jgi:hypothetical protein